MSRQHLLSSLCEKTRSRIVLAVIDGLGDIPGPGGGTPLEDARTPVLDELARRSECGQTVPVGPGITPGSGPAHLALFGYDPVAHNIGRGALSAVGVGFALQPGDVAARINLASIENGLVTDRRAGRPPTSLCAEVAALLEERIGEIDGVRLFVRPEMEHRATVVFRGPGLGDRCSDSDPQRTGLPPLPVEGQDDGSRRTAAIANRFIERAGSVLAGRRPVNGVLLRGFSACPNISGLGDLYRLMPAGIAAYPMYKGLARLVGMEVPDGLSGYEDELAALESGWDRHDFFFLHFKKTDSAGEDGDREEKLHQIEKIDRMLTRVTALSPDVLAVTGDHSTPAAMKGHSWHPVPLLIHSRHARYGATDRFGETACSRGCLGTFPAVDLMALLLAHAGKLRKFGA